MKSGTGTGWNNDNQSRTATVVVAASNSSTKSKQGADYICTGSSDQTTINAAINSLPAGGGSVHLTEGDFYISATIIITKPIHFSGDAQPTNIHLQNGSNSRMIEINFSTGQTNIQHNVIENMYLDGNALNQTSGTEAIKLATGTDYPRDLIIRNIWIGWYKGHGISATQNSGHHHYYDHLSIENCKGAGINVIGSALECVLFDCLLYADWYGIILANADSRMRVTNCRIEMSSYEGVKATSFNNLFLIGNDIVQSSNFSSGTYDAVSIGKTYAVVVGNKISGTSARYGINEIASADKNIIEGNIVTDGITGKINKIGANTITANNIIT